MQITNNYQPNFKSGKIGKKALLALSDRLPSGQFDVFVNKFNKKHEGSAYKILLDTYYYLCALKLIHK